MKRATHWLALLPASASFRAAADAALRPVAEERSGVDLADGFGLMPHDETFEVRYTDKGIGWVRGDLVGPDAWGEPVSIAWVNRRDPSSRVALGEDVHPEDVQIYWHKFPEQALRERYGGAFSPPFDVRLPSALEVRWKPFSWPELWLVVELSEPWTAQREADLAAAASAFVDQWNQRGHQGVIHDLSRPADLGARRRSLRIDFGSAETAALGDLLSALAVVPGLTIQHVEVSGAPGSSDP